MTTPRQRLDDAVKIINTFLKEKDIPPSTAIAAAVAGVTTLVASLFVSANFAVRFTKGLRVAVST